MSDNLPAVRTEAPVIVTRDTDSWAEMLPSVVELARAISQTDFVPESLRGSVGGTAAAILYGREVALGPMTSLQNVHVINGKPGLSAVIMRAQVLAAGHEIRIDETTTERCVMSGRRRGSDHWTTVTYTLADAERAGLTKRRGPKGGPNAYETNPRRMFQARATSELCELVFADVVRGMPSVEELEDEPDDGSAAPAPQANTTKVQRKTRTTKSGAAMGGAAPDDGGESRPSPPSSPPLPPLPGEPGDQTDGGAEPDSPPQGPAISPQAEPAAPSSSDSDGGAGAPPAAQPLQPELAIAPPAPPSDQPEHTGKPASAAMLRALHATFNRLGFEKEDRQLRLAITVAICGEDIASFNELSHEGARQVSETLARMNSRADVFRLMKEIANAPIEDLTGEDEQ